MDYFKKVLSKEEQEEIKKFNLTPKMKEAVKKLLLFYIYNCGTLKADKEADVSMNFMLNIAWQKNKTPDLIKEELMVAAKGAELLESAFQLIDKFQDKKEKELEIENPAI